MKAWEFTAILFATAVAIAPMADFLIGKKGNKWLKEKLITNPWLVLNELSFEFIARKSVRQFDNFFNRLFGETIVNLRAYFGSVLINIFFTYFIVAIIALILGAPTFSLDFENQKIFIEYVFFNNYSHYSFWAVLVINPYFNFISYSITRFLLRQINTHKLEFYMYILYILIDVLTASFISIILIMVLDNMDDVLIDLNLLSDINLAQKSECAPLGSIYVYFGCIVSAFYPTLIHFMLFMFNSMLFLLNGFRVALIYTLERFDESNKNLVLVIGTLIASVASIINAIVKLF